MIERYEAESFLTLAEELHFGRTAERLRVSTARVSQTIRKLERRVGAALFERTSRRVELTPLGRRLADELGPAWEAVGAALQGAVEAGRGLSGSLRVAYAGAAAGQLLVGVAELFRERAPGCEVLLREARMTETVRWLREDEADLCLVPLPVPGPGIACGPVLVREARMLAVPAGHLLDRPDGASAADLAAVPVVRLPDGAPVEPQQEAPAPGPAAETVAEALTLVAAGQGVLPVGAHTRRYYPRPDVAYVPLHGAPPLEWALIRRDGDPAARVRAFTEAAADLVADGR
ncbi:LysR family transcriptional regulator [Streptomyces novaecaesareae]|uniref:LysR family transcriptional regulator n=1 Tax=Streptomyces novaecaesareae TaxID=68244 RepID=UPI000527BD89|nr:LysR family transcriptional regulator [Streptomyces novaecaesareae]